MCLFFFKCRPIPWRNSVIGMCILLIGALEQVQRLFERCRSFKGPQFVFVFLLLTRIWVSKLIGESPSCLFRSLCFSQKRVLMRRSALCDVTKGADPLPRSELSLFPCLFPSFFFCKPVECLTNHRFYQETVNTRLNMLFFCESKEILFFGKGVTMGLCWSSGWKNNNKKCYC